MKTLSFQNNIYKTPKHKLNLLAKISPSTIFYLKFLKILIKSSSLAKKNLYKDKDWCKSSYDILKALESVGIELEVKGFENIESLNSPCVFIANHVSVLETVVLPIIIQPVQNVSFIVKESLLNYPVFGNILKARDPIAVTRKNPRQDLKNVLTKGVSQLNNNTSIIVFPQTTRSDKFIPNQFGSIGIKLAQKANVPVIPIALETSAWKHGKIFKDFGRINKTKKVYFNFGKPLSIVDRGQEEHKKIINFIENNLNAWNN